MKSRLLLIALLTSFSCFGQDIVVNGETIGRYLDVNESLELKPFTRQLSNGNYIRKFKGSKVELYPNLQIDRLCKFNKIKAILHLGLVTLVATIPGDGAGTFIKVVFIGMLVAQPIYKEIINKVIINMYIKGNTLKQRRKRNNQPNPL